MNTGERDPVATELAHLRAEIAKLVSLQHLQGAGIDRLTTAVDAALERLEALPPAPALPYRLPPMRSKTVTLSDWQKPEWQQLVDEIVEAASTTRKSMPSERVREVFDEMMGKARLKALQAEEEERTKFRRQIRLAVATGIVSLVLGSAAAFVSGHFEGRASAPPAATGAGH